jgi:O-methyltransferase
MPAKWLFSLQQRWGYNKTMNLLGKYPIISDQVSREELQRILDLFEETLMHDIEGDVVELGCYVGTTTLFLQRLLLTYKSHKELHAYDSFAGLPPKTAEDASPAGEQFKAGELKAPRNEFVRHFRQAGLPLPIMHKAWFSDLKPPDMPQKISFAFLDGDFYGSIHDSLKLVWPNLASGAIVIVDDYQSEALPGAKRAVDEWLMTHPARLQVASSLAILRP